MKDEEYIVTITFKSKVILKAEDKEKAIKKVSDLISNCKIWDIRRSKCSFTCTKYRRKEN